MTSEEYVESIGKLTEAQNNYFNIFLGIIGLFLGAVALLQWWYNTKESKLIEQRAVDKVFEEIHYKLGVKDISEWDSMIGDLINLQERMLTILEAYPEDIEKHLKGTLKSISSVSERNNTFFKSLENFLPLLLERRSFEYIMFIEELLESLPSSYSISNSEKVAINNIIDSLKIKIKEITDDNNTSPSVTEHRYLIKILSEYNR